MDQEIADGSASERLRKKQEQLGTELAELSKTGPLYEPERFKQVQISEYLTDFIRENPQSWTRIRLNRLLLEAAYPKEIARSIGGVYPDREIYSATPEDSQRCFNESDLAYAWLEPFPMRPVKDSSFPGQPPGQAEIERPECRPLGRQQGDRVKQRQPAPYRP